MGSAMARNLLRAGHEVSVYNRTRSKADELTSEGARVAESAADACRGCDGAITMLSDDGAVEGVVFGGNGITADVHIGCSTISTAMARRLAAHHKTYIS